MISVVYISNRYGGLDILRGNLRRQSVQDFELVFVDSLYHERKDQIKEFFTGMNVKHLGEDDISMEGYKTKLSRALNKGFMHCDGDLIVSIQDYIYIPHDGLEKFRYLNDLHNGKALITGVGHQYSSPSKEDIKNEKDLFYVFEKPYTKKPEIKFWSDPRHNGIPEVRVCEPVEWELNWASISKEAIFDLGGMDNEYDKYGQGWDNTNIAERAKILGYTILLDGSNECYGFNHDGWWPNPLKLNNISPIEYHFRQIGKMKLGEISARLNYLS